MATIPVSPRKLNPVVRNMVQRIVRDLGYQVNKTVVNDLGTHVEITTDRPIAEAQREIWIALDASGRHLFE